MRLSLHLGDSDSEPPPRPVDLLFPEAKALKSSGICPLCQKNVGDFRDKASIKEATISGLCQACQDEVFCDPDDNEEEV